MTTARQKVLTYLTKSRTASAREISRALKMSAPTVRHHLRVLVSEGRLEMRSGASFTWRTANFWATRYVWVDQSETELITYSSGAASSKLKDAFKNQARLDLAPASSLLAELPLLALLGWYLIELHHEDSAAGITAVT